MTQSHEQFTVEEHEEIDTATVIYEETAALVKSALTDIQVMIDQAYDWIQTTGQEQNVADLNTVIEGSRGANGGTPKPKPAKIDDTLKPRNKLRNEMSLLETTEWIKEY